MSSANSNVPPLLERYAGDGFAETVQMCAGLDQCALAGYVEDHPLIESNAHHYVDVSPIDARPDHALVLPLDFGETWGTETALRVIALRLAVERPTRIVVFPNNPSNHEGMYRVSQEERRRIEHGDFSPLAERQLAVLESLNITDYHYFGFGQGAAVGAAALKMLANVSSTYRTVHSSVLAEPLNTAERSFKETMAAMRVSSEEWRSWRRQSYGRASMNESIAYGLGVRTFPLQVAQAAHTMRSHGHPGQLAILRTGRDQTVPDGVWRLLATPGQSGILRVQIPDCGYELGKQPLAYALLGKMTLDGFSRIVTAAEDSSEDE